MTNRTDCQLVILGPFGRIDLTHVTGFVETNTDGAAWAGTFQTIERDTRAVDDLYGLLEAEFFSQTQEPVRVYRYEPGDLVWQYDNARLSLAPGGVAFTASGRVRV